MYQHNGVTYVDAFDSFTEEDWDRIRAVWGTHRPSYANDMVFISTENPRNRNHRRSHTRTCVAIGGVLLLGTALRWLVRKLHV